MIPGYACIRVYVALTPRKAQCALFIDTLIHPSLLREMEQGGFVSRRSHPTLPLDVLNYTPRAAYSGTWNDATRRCRGLILHRDTGEVVARPFEKFFNLAEHETKPELGPVPVEPFKVYDKFDGSLGILYPTPDGHAIATRGSFTSEQALHATEVWKRRYSLWSPTPGYTYLFEILFPANRIVVDYGSTDDLILLSAVPTDPSQGNGWGWADEPHHWPGPFAWPIPGFATVQGVVAERAFANAEGYVLHFQGGLRVKVKFAEYVRLHRILTSVSSRTIWAALKAGDSLLDIVKDVPTEFRNFVHYTQVDLRAEYKMRENYGLSLLDECRSFNTRKEQAAFLADKGQVKAIVFKMLDGHPYDNVIWDMIKPKRVTPFMDDEEAA